MTEHLTTAEVISNANLLTIGSAVGQGGLRARISAHIDNPERAERAALACRCGWNHLAICWVEMPNPRTAIVYEAALLRAYFNRYGYLPPTGNLALLRTAVDSPSEEEVAALEWLDSYYPLVHESEAEIPEGDAVYIISAGKPEDPEIWDPPTEGVTLCACRFAPYEPGCPIGSGPQPRRKRPVTLDLRDDASHLWLHEVRRRRLERERRRQRRLEDFLE